MSSWFTSHEIPVTFKDVAKAKPRNLTLWKREITPKTVPSIYRWMKPGPTLLQRLASGVSGVNASQAGHAASTVSNVASVVRGFVYHPKMSRLW